MESLECPQCGNPVANQAAVCGACGREVKADERGPSPGQNRPGGKKVYAVLTVLLALLGGAALLIMVGQLPNPLKGGSSTAAVVNGEKISVAEVDQRLDFYKKMSGKGGHSDATTPEGRAAAADLRKKVLEAMIQEKVLTTEADREKISVSPQEVADKIGAVKKNLNLSDKDFETFLNNNGMTMARFEKRIEKDLLISKLVAKGMQERGMTQEAWIDELNKRAKVERLAQ